MHARLVVGVALVALLGACRGILGFEDPAVRADADVPALTVGFRQAESLADEEAGTIRVPVVLSTPSDVAVEVRYDVTGGTASAGDDFAVAGTMLTFAPGVTRQEIAIAITRDAATEGDETIELALSAANGATIDRGAHQLTISAEILPRLGFAQTSSATGEAAPSTASIVLDRAVASPVTVELVVEGTATAADYALASPAVTIAAGATSASLSLGEIDDALDEDDETVVLTLRDPSLGVLVGDAATLTHTIADDDAPPAIRFATPASDTNENAGATAVAVVLSAPSGKPITVDYDAAFSGTATAADATVGAPGTLAIAPGETMATIEVALANDTADENVEAFSIQLGNASNATLGSPAAHTITLTDDDAEPTIAFAAAATNAPENGAGAFQVAVALSAASEKTVSVSFSRSGTAAGNDAMIPTSTTMVFAPGETTRQIRVDVQNDAFDENTETVVLTLASPTNGTLGAQATHTLSIADEDGPPRVSFDPAQANASVAEGNPPGTRLFAYDVVLSIQSGKPVTVPVTVTSTATNPTDFTIPTPLPIVFSPGVVRQTVQVRVVADATVEPNEDVTLVLGTPTNATASAPQSRTHTIANDD